MKIPEMITRYEIMACPVCGETIAAEVAVLPKLGSPVILDGTKVDIPVKAEMTRFNLRHACQGRVAAAAGRIVADAVMQATEGDA